MYIILKRIYIKNKCIDGLIDVVGSVKDLNHWNKSYSKVYFDKTVEKRSLVSILSKHKYPEDLNEVDFNNHKRFKK